MVKMAKNIQKGHQKIPSSTIFNEIWKVIDIYIHECVCIYIYIEKERESIVSTNEDKVWNIAQ